MWIFLYLTSVTVNMNLELKLLRMCSACSKKCHRFTNLLHLNKRCQSSSTSDNNRTETAEAEKPQQKWRALS